MLTPIIAAAMCVPLFFADGSYVPVSKHEYTNGDATVIRFEPL
jgi:hypothetical protein